MNELQVTVQEDFEQWENQPPNLVNRGLNKITAPVALVLSPVMKKIAPLLEEVVSGANDIAASAVGKISDEIPDIENLDKKSFEEWFEKADNSARKYKSLGIASLSAEGGATGAGGVTLLLVDIPASFGLILGFANKIAFTYGLPIKSEDIQIAILQAITAGSADNLKEKVQIVLALKQTEKTLSMSWKKIYQQSLDNILSTAQIIIVVREFLKKIGINVSKRKASQIIPIIGGVSGAVINGAWASDALEAVRQFSRNWIVQKYFSKQQASTEN